MIDRFMPGAVWSPPDVCHFLVWAPAAKRVAVRLLGQPERTVPLEAAEGGYHQAAVGGVAPGQKYFFEVDGRPSCHDPASRCQPDGVHGPAAVIDPRFLWHDQGWHAPALKDFILYELHIGTFTPEGTFDAAAGQLDRLRDLGVNAVEVMPVAQFPGGRNWGYDGVYPFCVQGSYGGAGGFKRFIDAAHRKGVAVILDVVYNHLGPEGNYSRETGPYFTNRHHTPWGEALNFDGPDSEPVRHFFLMNALMWQEEFHLDGLRLDAIHAIRDESAIPFLLELREQADREAAALGRPFPLILESDLNDARFLRPPERHGLGFAASWSDDFHHSVHALLTGERQGYYEDFGDLDHLVWAWRDGYTYAGHYSRHRRRRHGNSSAGLRREQFVVCVQNHDQVGNRACGDRLSALVDFESLKLAAGLLLLSPFVPMLFMGEEHGEKAPFQFFTSYGDGRLIDAVRKGRRAEFAAFRWQGEVPDPQAELTFQLSKLRPEGGDPVLRDLYRELIALRRLLPLDGPREVVGDEEGRTMWARYEGPPAYLLGFHFGDGPRPAAPPGEWECVLDSAAPRWRGPGEGGGRRGFGVYGGGGGGAAPLSR